MRFFLPHANFAKTIIVYIITGTSDYSTLTINHNQKNFNQAQTATNSIPRCFEFNVEIINRNQNNQFWFSVFWFALLLKNHSKTYFSAYTRNITNKLPKIEELGLLTVKSVITATRSIDLLVINHSRLICASRLI